jgi:hypothetical protein
MAAALRALPTAVLEVPARLCWLTELAAPLLAAFWELRASAKVPGHRSRLFQPKLSRIESSTIMKSCVPQRLRLWPGVAVPPRPFDRAGSTARRSAGCCPMRRTKPPSRRLPVPPRSRMLHYSHFNLSLASLQNAKRAGRIQARQNSRAGARRGTSCTGANPAHAWLRCGLWKKLRGRTGRGRGPGRRNERRGAARNRGRRGKCGGMQCVRGRGGVGAREGGGNQGASRVLLVVLRPGRPQSACHGQACDGRRRPRQGKMRVQMCTRYHGLQPPPRLDVDWTALDWTGLGRGYDCSGCSASIVCVAERWAAAPCPRARRSAALGL